MRYLLNFRKRRVLVLRRSRAPLISVSHKMRFPKKGASKDQWIKVLSITPFNNPYHTSQVGYQSLLKTLGVKIKA